MATFAREQHQSDAEVFAARIERAERDGATREYRRFHDATGLATIALQQCARDLRAIAKRVGELRDERDLERAASTIDAAVETLAAVFTQSPMARAAETLKPEPF